MAHIHLFYHSGNIIYSVGFIFAPYISVVLIKIASY